MIISYLIWLYWLGIGHSQVTSLDVDLKKWETAIYLRIRKGYRFDNWTPIWELEGKKHISEVRMTDVEIVHRFEDWTSMRVLHIYIKPIPVDMYICGSFCNSQVHIYMVNYFRWVLYFMVKECTLCNFCSEGQRGDNRITLWRQSNDTAQHIK
jgi:hypothetical protein